MEEQKAQSARMINSKNALFRVLAGSIGLSFFALFGIAYFYGSVQTAGDLLITPKNYHQVELRKMDPQTGKMATYFVDKIVLIDNQDPKNPQERVILEPAYIKIFDTLKKDNLALLKKGNERDRPLLSLVLQLKPDRKDGAVTYEPLVLQQVDFYADDRPYRVSGRLDKQRSDESYHFIHKGVCKDLTYLLQLI